MRNISEPQSERTRAGVASPASRIAAISTESSASLPGRGGEEDLARAKGREVVEEAQMDLLHR